MVDIYRSHDFAELEAERTKDEGATVKTKPAHRAEAKVVTAPDED